MNHYIKNRLFIQLSIHASTPTYKQYYYSTFFWFLIRMNSRDQLTFCSTCWLQNSIYLRINSKIGVVCEIRFILSCTSYDILCDHMVITFLVKCEHGPFKKCFIGAIRIQNRKYLHGLCTRSTCAFRRVRLAGLLLPIHFLSNSNLHLGYILAQRLGWYPIYKSLN